MIKRTICCLYGIVTSWASSERKMRQTTREPVYPLKITFFFFYVPPLELSCTLVNSSHSCFPQQMLRVSQGRRGGGGEERIRSGSGSVWPSALLMAKGTARICPRGVKADWNVPRIRQEEEVERQERRDDCHFLSGDQTRYQGVISQMLLFMQSNPVSLLRTKTS